jgi:transketolase
VAETLSERKSVAPLEREVASLSERELAKRGNGKRPEAENGADPGGRARLEAKELARRIRRHALRMTSAGGSSHVGSALSCADLLAALYGAGGLRIDPEEPRHPDRDRLILSKGHAGAACYAALAESGFFPVEKLSTHYQDGSDLSGHVSHKGVPGVELSTGSLGHGLPVGAGMAYGAKLDGKSHRVVVILSDGECDEGSNWEAILFAAHHRLDNLVAIVDYNKIQSLAQVSETLGLEPFGAKWESFGWSVREVDGHDVEALRAAWEAVPFERGRPSCLIAHTTKGKGVSFMEGSVLWHYRTARGEEFDAALAELEVDPNAEREAGLEAGEPNPGPKAGPEERGLEIALMETVRLEASEAEGEGGTEGETESGEEAG